jgi:glycosyltransferase involved in cell wall biosynthesis
MLGMPIVGLATTELVTVIENGVSGYVDTNLDRLVEVMQELRQAPELARQWGVAARRRAEERFNMQRFIQDWERAFSIVTDRGIDRQPIIQPLAITGGRA